MIGDTSLPVVRRELLVASRRKQTYQGRMSLAFISFVVTGLTTWAITLYGVGPIPGPQLFALLGSMIYLFCLVSAMATVDAVSSEKRDGTIGLLFLTRLRSYDIILGKLTPALVQSLYALIGVLPIFAIPLLMGGVSADQLASSALALSIIVIWSLSFGMLLSVLSKNGARLMPFLAIAALFWGFVAAEVLRIPAVSNRFPTASWVLLQINPKHLVEAASGIVPRPIAYSFWVPALAHIGMAIAFFGASCWLLPRTWQDLPSVPRLERLKNYWRTIRFGTPRRMLRHRERFLAGNPVVWLRSREIVASLPFLIAGFLCGIFALIVPHLAWKIPPAPERDLLLFGLPWFFGASVMTFGPLGSLAAYAGQSLTEDRKSGALELLVSTPLTVGEILRGHWLAALRKTLPPLILGLCMVALCYVWVMTITTTFNNMTVEFIPTLKRTVVLAFAPAPPIYPECVMVLFASCAAFLLPFAMVGLLWTGLWLAMRVQQAKTVAGAAWVIVLALPWVTAVVVRSALLTLRDWFGWNVPDNVYFWALVTVSIFAAHSIALTIYFRRDLLKNFRLRATMSAVPDPHPLIAIIKRSLHLLHFKRKRS